MLKAFRLEQRKRQLADLDWDKENDFVFVGDHGRAPAANRVNKRLARIVARANATGAAIPKELTPHSLRHTALFLLEQAGVAPSIRMALGGHSTASMALHYIDHASLRTCGGRWGHLQRHATSK
jgi:integrase